MNIRQANGLGRVHVAKPGMKETYYGRAVNEEDWVTTSREANCTGCARAGASRWRLTLTEVELHAGS